MSVALLLGVLHAFVDAATVTVALRMIGGEAVVVGALAGVLLYDLVAFALQPALGWWQDRWGSPRHGMVAGLLLTLGAVALATGEVTPVVAVVLAGLGNAAFHLGAGAHVLRLGLDHAAPAGLLVAPGALGLGFGLWFGRTAAAGPVWLVALPVLLGLAVVARDLGGRAPDRGGEPRRPVVGGAVGILLLLLISVGIRALVGGSATRGLERGTWLLVGVPLVAFAGKALGGLVADRWGWVRTSVVALLASAPLLVVAHPATLLVGLLVFQMTMPITLVAVARTMPTRLATGFGLTCLALVLGGLPTMFGWGAELIARPLLPCWVLVSAGAAWAALTGFGLSWRRTGEPVPVG